MIQFDLKTGVAMLALVAVPVTAHAQIQPQTPADAAPQVDSNQDIIVTTTRSATNLQNTPVAVTALSGDTLRQRGATSLLDV